MCLQRKRLVYEQQSTSSAMHAQLEAAVTDLATAHDKACGLHSERAAAMVSAYKALSVRVTDLSTRRAAYQQVPSALPKAPASATSPCLPSPTPRLVPSCTFTASDRMVLRAVCVCAWVWGLQERSQFASAAEDALGGVEKARRSAVTQLEQQAADATERARAAIEAAETKAHGTRKKARKASEGNMQKLMSSLHEHGYLGG